MTIIYLCFYFVWYTPYCLINNHIYMQIREEGKNIG